MGWGFQKQADIIESFQVCPLFLMYPMILDAGIAQTLNYTDMYSDFEIQQF